MIIVKYIYAYILIHSIDLWIKSLICDVMRRKVCTGHARWPFLAHPTLKAIFAESHAELWLTVSSRRESCNFQGHNDQCWSMHSTFTPCSDIQLAYCYSQISLIAGVKEPQRVSRCRVCRRHFDARWQYCICFDGWEAQSEWSSRCHQVIESSHDFGFLFAEAWKASSISPRPPLADAFPYFLPYASYHEASAFLSWNREKESNAVAIDRRLIERQKFHWMHWQTDGQMMQRYVYRWNWIWREIELDN